MTSKRNQSGFALLMYMVVLIGITSFGIGKLLTSAVSQKNEQAKEKNIQVLQKAKEALLSYAVNYIVDNKPGNMGALPCPDVNVTMSIEGNQDTNCGLIGINSIGLFPFKSVGLGSIKDASGECLWYIVSGNYKNDPGYNLRNWDSSGGFIKLVDENGNLQHKNTADDFPVALIISPGPSLGQNRTAGSASPDCHTRYNSGTNKYDRLAYLEGGNNLDYSTNPGTTSLPDLADTVWTIMTSSIESNLKSVQYNDQVVAIYKKDIWERVKQTKDLDTTNAESNIRKLTKDLAECLKFYGTDLDTSDGTLANINYNLPYPADIDLADYSDANLYQDNSSGYLYGRFPQKITVSESVGNIITQDTHFVRFTTGLSYCESVIPDFDEELWNNWKDHFFYVLANDSKPGSLTALSSKCLTAANCLTITENLKTVVAIVFFAEEASLVQDRTLATASNDQLIWNQYLDGINQTLYLSTDVTNDYSSSLDYSYCIVISGTTLGFEECSL